jgi:hypothetical protein
VGHNGGGLDHLHHPCLPATHRGTPPGRVRSLEPPPRGPGRYRGDRPLADGRSYRGRLGTGFFWDTFLTNDLVRGISKSDGARVKVVSISPQLLPIPLCRSGGIEGFVCSNRQSTALRARIEYISG